jgi:hypothetical protein
MYSDGISTDTAAAGSGAPWTAAGTAAAAAAATATDGWLRHDPIATCPAAMFGTPIKTTMYHPPWWPGDGGGQHVWCKTGCRVRKRAPRSAGMPKVTARVRKVAVIFIALRNQSAQVPAAPRSTEGHHRAGPTQIKPLRDTRCFRHRPVAKGAVLLNAKTQNGHQGRKRTPRSSGAWASSNTATARNMCPPNAQPGSRSHVCCAAGAHPDSNSAKAVQVDRR